MIRFLHQGRRVELPAPSPDATVLDYLRDDARCTGTKEGCASGDCGACTVVTARVDGGELCFEPMNSCIAPLGSLQGAQLITVEELGRPGELHPVQQAMVDAHGSQCGFCTPGFVMSLFALFHSDAAADRQLILEALGGNLCRCTGYRPIIDAALAVLDGPRDDAYSARRNEIIAELESLQGSSTHSEPREQAYHLPRTVDELTALLGSVPDLRLVAGGTDLMLEVTQGLGTLPAVADLRQIPLLQELRVDGEGFSIGAAVTHRRAQPALLEDYPELAELIERFGALQIRSRGTVAGNVENASPIGDWPPVLLALDGRVTLASAEGERTLPLSEFFLDYRKTAQRDGEFIQSLQLPRRDGDLFLRAYKISKRFEDDISSVCLVAALGLDGHRITRARIACGGMAAIPQRAAACEAALQDMDFANGDITPAMEALKQDFSPITDARASADYRITVASNLLRRLQLEFNGSIATRVFEGVAHG